MRVVTPVGCLMLMAMLAVAPGCSGGTAPPEIVVTAKDYKYTPDRLTLKAGQTVRLTLVNSDALEHDLSSGAAVRVGKQASSAGHAGHAMPQTGEVGSLHLHTPPNSRASMEITPQNKGTYEIICTTEGHKDLGMTGTLVVE